MKRHEVKEAYRWRLEDIFISNAEWEKELASVNKEMTGILSFKGKLKNADKLLEAFNFNDSIGKRLEKLFCYAMMLNDQDLSDTKASELKAKALTIYTNFSSYASFIDPELSSLPEDELQSFIDDPKFAPYEYSLKQIIVNKRHILSEGEEKILALSGKTFSAFSQIHSKLDNVDMVLPKIDVDGVKTQLTHGNYGLLLQNPNQAIRAKVFKGYYKAYEGIINTLGANFAASVGKDNLLASVRKYSSAQEQAVSSNDVPAGVYDKLVKKVNDNLKNLHNYMAFRKKIMGVEQLHMHDLHCPIFEQADLKLDFDKAYQLCIEGLKPMGEEYNKLLKQAIDDRWIDVEETENKRSGAYCCGVYGVHPYVLLNYTPTTNDIFTIAHEMGHAMHSYYSAKVQPYAKNDYAIFVAEVASTVNEVLLLKHLLKTVDNPNIKKYLLSYYLDMFRTTLFRQTMFAEFESVTHSDEQSGKPLTVEHLNKTYAALNKKYYGPATTQDKQIRLEWSRIPHFYRAFYVYQYSTGIISAINIANMMLSGQKDAFTKFKTFLSAGGSKSPFEILKDTGVDLLSDEPYEYAFSEFEKTLSELKALCF